MTDAQASLRERYRGTLAARAQRVGELLPAARQGGEGPALHELMGELHTLKGEARMLGLAPLATLCHVLEDRFRDESPDFDALAAVLDGVLLSLSPGTSGVEVEQLWRTALEALGERFVARESAGAAPASEPETAQAARWVQVDANVVDRLCESLAALTIDFGRYSTRHEALPGDGRAAISSNVDGDAEQLRERLSEALRMSLDLRLHPVEPLLSRLAAHARVHAGQLGKSVEVHVTSAGVRIERAILERLSDPLLHVMQNAVEHGIEPPQERGDKPPGARIDLIAETSGSTVTLHIVDDGRGIDTRAVLARASRDDGEAPVDVESGRFDVLFQPGFTTRERADERAGRGVGLDVVRRTVEALGGTIAVSSERGRGARFSFSIPASLTQESLVVVQSGGALYGLAARWIVSIEQRKGENASTFAFRGRTLPLRSLAALVGEPEPVEERVVLVIELDDKQYALACHKVVRNAELLRRPTSRRLTHHSGISASAQLDDGELVLLLDLAFIRRSLSQATVAKDGPRAQTTVARQRVLIVDDSVVVRDLLSEVLVTAGYHVEAATNGKEALTLLSSFRPDVVVSDVEMPEMNGFDLLQAIRSSSETLPVVLVTARSSTEDRRRASVLGASAYVAKGEFRSESLVQVVRRYLPEEA